MAAVAVMMDAVKVGSSMQGEENADQDREANGDSMEVATRVSSNPNLLHDEAARVSSINSTLHGVTSGGSSDDSKKNGKDNFDSASNKDRDSNFRPSFSAAAMVSQYPNFLGAPDDRSDFMSATRDSQNPSVQSKSVDDVHSSFMAAARVSQNLSVHGASVLMQNHEARREEPKDDVATASGSQEGRPSSVWDRLKYGEVNVMHNPTSQSYASLVNDNSTKAWFSGIF